MYENILPPYHLEEIFNPFSYGSQKFEFPTDLMFHINKKMDKWLFKLSP
jgi:hypothetical protein